ncbi:hypothetical protein BKA04_000792 [Cryobacterium mesophilum]|uniref:DUF262 domain-containing protein n=1 Tax=Terrimesophilobacter mesophilus TaxID=433647 RepID=A0A4R8VC30_9MICO|nr:DUF262 domain-containing protein [Terrimesophilobacter mesophilus]MBB5632569.1 hypothetical protein [Terrimesophilobacter mesophilus]TFB79387.1 DUF262 domain-containing protein [Terrimesophilobacter mesophilus]
MVTATNVDATAVSTIGWLSTSEATIVVPVYQRQYRWDIGGCERLLADIRAVSDAGPGHRHFLGSILSSANAGDGSGELVLIDGQQRITTLMLLIAALHHTVKDDDPGLAAELSAVLVHADDPTRTRLRPHRAWAEIFDSVVLDRRLSEHDARDSRFDDNYAFFRSQVRGQEVPRIWRGLQKLEHVAISLGTDANAQQIFESLNSTGAPLRDHELIHNYLLMGLSHEEQLEIEDSFWVPIEQNTGESIGSFWRHYLVMTTGREVAVAGERGVYDAFRQRFPRLGLGTLRQHAAEWREFSEIYRILLDPSLEQDAEIGRQLAWVNAFGRGMYPLVLRAYHDHARGVIEKAALVETLEQVQSLLLRRAVVGVSTDRLVARMCRAREAGAESLERAIARITPSDERVRVALKYAELPYPGYVLGRLAGVDSIDVEVDHIVPLAPSDTWSGDGVREWADYSEDEQNSHRALAPTLGNLALLEEPLLERALGASFPVKRDRFYASSAIPATRSLAEVSAWSTAAIAERSAQVTEQFLTLWKRPGALEIDDDGLTPILDAHSRRGWPHGWQREFDYVEYRGEHWEVHDVKHLFHRVFLRLWADARADVVRFSDRRGGPLFESQAWNGEWEAFDDTHHLYLGWDSRYMMTAVQGVLEEAGLAAEVFIKYSYIGDAM